MSYRAVKARRSHEALHRRFAPDGRAPPACLEVKKATVPLVGCDADFLGHRPEPPRRVDACEGAPEGPNFEGVTRSAADSQLQRGDSGLFHYPICPVGCEYRDLACFRRKFRCRVPKLPSLAVVWYHNRRLPG